MSVFIHSTARVEDGASLGDGVEIGPFCHIGPQVELGAGTRLHGSVTISGRTRLGEACEVFPGAILGGPPQILGQAPTSDCRLEIGARTILREHVTAHVGSPDHSGVTRIGPDCYLMIGVHVGHDCAVGENCVIANNVPLAGHVRLGDNVWIGGQAAIHQFTEIGAHAFVAGGAILVGDVIPFGMAVGNHAHLAGLNITGLKRRGFSRQDIRTLRGAYRALFEGEAAFHSRLAAAAETYAAEPLAMRMVDFARASRKRPLCLPEQDG